MIGDNVYGIIPPSGEYDKDWPVHFNLPQGASGELSTGGWTADVQASGNYGNEGFIQQTFLGASIRDFDLSAGFGDTASSMTINLVNDEYNISDGQPLGKGDDPYHSGISDQFLPPVVGTPVYFKFGKNPATIEQAFRQTYDDLYGIQTLPAKVAPNAWGYTFPETSWDAEDFDELPPYHLVDRINNVVQDRSLLWDIDTSWRGRAHFNFGGILQSYTQNKGPGGKPVYSVSITDPREILSNVDVLLNNYQDTTFNYKNLINLYGFLEYDPSTSLFTRLSTQAQSIGVIDKFTNNTTGEVLYVGVNAAWDAEDGLVKVEPKNPAMVQPQDGPLVNLKDQYYFGQIPFDQDALPEYFPITGQGFSRRSDKGMPWYRISQGLSAMFQYYGFLPQEYKDAGFGGTINFRGFNYVVDFGGIPTEKIPLLYYMDFDKIDLLSLAQELCDIISHELYVTLLPVIDHPASKFLFNYNNYQVSNDTKENIIAGIIRLDAIDKTQQPQYGAIKSYIEELQDRGIDVENSDIGFELSNVTTDKFVVGAQEVETYFFHSERDRDELWTGSQANNVPNRDWLQQFQWDLKAQEQQQILPYYGLLGNNAVSIPRGFGSYQQILLDATNLNAYGVGNYYVATELELRSALISYQRWKDFLLSYNETYVEDTSEHRAFLSALSSEQNQINRVLQDFRGRSGFNTIEEGPAKTKIDEVLKELENRQYAVTVPRCVWHSDKPAVDEFGYPQSPCSPPFGYPLYYRRATAIGIVEAGVGKIVNAKTRIVKDAANLKKSFENKNSPLLKLPKNTLFNRMKAIRNEINKLAEENKSDPNFKSQNKRYRALIDQLSEHTQIMDNYDKMAAALRSSNESVAFVENLENGPLGKFLFNIEKTAKKHEENAKKVYNFVKKIADECLGKKFLVRIPKIANVGYSKTISTFDGTTNSNIKNGPFGFPPRPISSDPKALGEFSYDINTLPAFGTGMPSFVEGLNSAIGSRLSAGNASNLWLDYLQDYESDKELTRERKISDPSLARTGALKGNYNPFSESWEWNYKPEPQGGFFGFNIFGVNVSALQALRAGVPWSSMPPAIRQGLCPIDMNNLMSDSKRVQCYARYNHSEVLDFTGVSANDMVQQVMTKGGQFVPDVVEELPNNNIDNKLKFEALAQTKEEQGKKERQPDSMAFVKCSIDEKLYMPPKLKKYNLDVYANEYDFTLSIPEPKKTEGKNEDCTPKITFDYPEALPLFSIPRNGGVDGKNEEWYDFRRVYEKNTDSWIIDSDIEKLDDKHVYALVTVPGRVRSIIDTRWNDGQNQEYQALQLKHLMTQDTVQIPQFSKPNIPQPGEAKIPCEPPPVFLTKKEATEAGKEYGLQGAENIDLTKFPELFGIDDSDNSDAPDDIDYGPDGSGLDSPSERFGAVSTEHWIPGKMEDWLRLSLEEISSARSLSKKIIAGSITNNPNVRISYTQPSPVFPDIVAIPMMSHERCYGPWLSSSKLNPSGDPRVKYADIGGKVEFIKDENFAPWNFAGYQLMNEAGSLQAQFSNSLLLFSERGGFAIPDAPTGIALASALKQAGPLVTSIGVNVSQGGVKTTVKMDLYTAKWGKLAKQKEMAISQIARERQKLKDEQNSAIRRGLGKRSTSTDLVNSVMNAGGQQVLEIVNGVTQQTEANRELGKEVSEGVIVVGANGGVAYNDAKDLERAQSTRDANLFRKEETEQYRAGMVDSFRAFSRGPHKSLPSTELDTTKSTNYMIYSDNHTPEE
jgi:hypothetical protein